MESMEGSGSSSFRNTERVEYYLNDVSEGIIFTVAIVVFDCSKEGAILQECDDILSGAGASTTSAEYRLCGIKRGRIFIFENSGPNETRPESSGGVLS